MSALSNYFKRETSHVHTSGKVFIGFDVIWVMIKNAYFLRWSFDKHLCGCSRVLWRWQRLSEVFTHTHTHTLSEEQELNSGGWVRWQVSLNGWVILMPPTGVLMDNFIICFLWITIYFCVSATQQIVYTRPIMINLDSLINNIDFEKLIFRV